MEILIYTPEVSNRLNYIFNLLFDIAGVEISMTYDMVVFQSYKGPRLSYGFKPEEEILYQESAGLLFRKDIEPIDTDILTHDGIPAFMGVQDPDSMLPFDIFSASFFMVSRYEEYLPFKGDTFGRFKPTDSIAVKGGFLHLPVVNIWVKKMKDILKKKYPELTFKESKFSFIPTIDIDHAYAYRLRSFYRVMGGYGRSIMKGRIFELIERSAVLLRLTKDPFDTYDLINNYHKKHELHPLFFILFAQYGGNDNNVSLNRSKFKAMVRTLDKNGTIGIHPSLASGKKYNTLEREINGLSRMVEKDIFMSRQHFLKFSMPATFRSLMGAGIKDDFSMGYSSKPGFRAGIATPFLFYDLSSNNVTPLIIHPVPLMDVTLRDYLRLNTEKAMELTHQLIDETKNVNGEFISLWHNESFSNRGRWKGWRKVYEDMLDYCCR